MARFDGVTFERVEIASPHKRRSDGIYGFFADEGGSLWMGHEYGGISRRLADGSFQHYGLTEGMPEATVTGISQDASGTMWALSSGLLRLEGQHWRKVTEDEGLPAGPAFSIYPDQHGIAASVLDHGRQGHFGLMGMRERANRIRGELTITSPPTAGTQVTLVVPARVAFVVAPWWRRLARTGAPTG